MRESGVGAGQNNASGEAGGGDEEEGFPALARRGTALQSSMTEAPGHDTGPAIHGCVVLTRSSAQPLWQAFLSRPPGPRVPTKQLCRVLHKSEKGIDKGRRHEK
eukprot:1156892-Pelagomonas_calceolata.AAC.1